MSNNLQDAIKNLIQLAKIESLQTKDLFTELSTLFDKAKQLEDKIVVVDKKYNDALQEKHAIEKILEEYKREFVEPVWKIKADRIEFDQLKFKFDVEKEYQKREVEIYREIVRTLTATNNYNESYTGGGNGYGASWSKGITHDKPSLPCNTNFNKENK